MNFENRLFKIEMAMDGLPKKPDFDSMSEEELDFHIRRMLEKEHREDGTRSYEMAEHKLMFELNEGLISQQEFEMFLEGEKKFWNRKG
jgi:hypothetical protein